MSTLSKSRLAVAAAFLAAIVAVPILALTRMGDSMYADLSSLAWPKSIDEMRLVQRRLVEITETHVPGKHQAWAARAAIQAWTGKTEMNNLSVLKAPTGRLFRGNIYALPIQNARDAADDIIELAGLALENEVEVLYFSLPDTRIKGMEDMPDYLPYRDYNAVLDAMLFRLREGGVPQLDTRYNFLAQDASSDNIVQKTGFQLSGTATFAAFTYLVESIAEKFSLQLDPDNFYRNPDNYQFTPYPQYYIGELGKETGPAFSGLDDFIAITPRFDSDFQLEAFDSTGNMVRKSGNAEETILDPGALIFTGDYYEFNPQHYYAHADLTQSTINNRLDPGGPKILFVHDSYSAGVVDLLAPLCGELHTLSFPQPTGGPYATAENRIQNNIYDLVIVSFFSQNLLNTGIRPLILNPRGGAD